MLLHATLGAPLLRLRRTRPTGHSKPLSTSTTIVPAQRLVSCSYKDEAKSVPESGDGLLMMRAEQDLHDFCSVHPELGAQCWAVHNWLVDKCKEAGAHDLGAGNEQLLGAGSGSEYVLQRTLREIMAAGSIDEVYRSIRMLKQIEERHRTGQPPGAVAASSAPLPSSQVIGEQERLLLTQLFHTMDTNGDGHLSWQEFLDALHNIDDDLEEEEQELVSTALGLHGTLTLEQFLAVVQQAEEMRDQRDECCDARRLRHMTHKDHRPDGVDRCMGTCL